jgi:hypothetical protein
MGLSNAERQKRWRNRRRAAGLPLRRAPERPAAGGQPEAPGSLRDTLVDFFAAYEAAHGRGSYDGDGGEPPDRLAETAIGELEVALHDFVTEYNFDEVEKDPAVEAARLRLMAKLSAIVAIPTRDEMHRRQEAERQAVLAQRREARAKAKAA